jgi:hypothetical protein
MPTSFNGALVIREQNGRIFYEAKWRDSCGRQVKRRVVPAWVERDGAGRWRRRGGRVPDGCFDEKAAIVEMSRLIDVREEELAAAPPPGAIAFDQVAADWLHHVEHVDGIKPSTLKSYRYNLRAPSAKARKRGRSKAGGRAMAEFGGQPIATITTARSSAGSAGWTPSRSRTHDQHLPPAGVLGARACRPPARPVRHRDERRSGHFEARRAPRPFAAGDFRRRTRGAPPGR